MTKYYGSFNCPECNSSRTGATIGVSPNFDMDDPVSHILEWIQCDNCEAYIPAHIAERWDGLTKDNAKKEWLEKYRNKFEF